MIVLGIDPGLTTTGWALLTEDAELLEQGRWRVRAPDPETVGFLLALKLLALIVEHRPDALAIESQFVDFGAQGPARGGRAQAQGKLAVLRGQLTLAAQLHGLRVVPVAPQEAKAALAFGGADKPAMVAHANERFGLGLKDSEADVADALAVALAGVAVLTRPGQAAMAW